VRARAAVDLPVPRRPQINTPPIVASMALRMRASRIFSCPTIALNGNAVICAVFHCRLIGPRSLQTVSARDALDDGHTIVVGEVLLCRKRHVACYHTHEVGVKDRVVSHCNVIILRESNEPL